MTVQFTGADTSHLTEQTSIFGHILVPTDGSEASVAAGHMAVRLAAALGARITFVYVIDDGVIDGLVRASRQTENQVRAELEQKGLHYLHYLMRQAVSAGVMSAQELCHGLPYEEIHRLVRERRIDLIVMGRVSHQRPRQLRIGDVTSRVLDRAPCPVLVVQ
jgi:nucleotide-binding universal stress UspA family protein